ncbi:probable methyltransferase TCM_000336 [Vitis vinifera]|uniref:Salicylate carboxymethyltransferase n=3 Tax=Vitis vinifera TaxID=29760 RepID=A0A438BRA2_VITVI|nr:probable methyltransferase TCM_000336 [Vitis vinifera]RVW13487.1 Salicylate carboxymethyltransferase [Vitis vinifera]|eukprot:XP_002265889.2 PREDICTED: salicylate carboxymethyltransferase [Vitis vinifera]
MSQTRTSMDVEKAFHMTGGVGETSYARNSSLQKKASDVVKHITIETIQQLYLTTTPRSLGIADLGCSSGPNTLSFIKDIFDAVEGTSSQTLLPAPEFRVYLNDLPTNDFNTIFKALPDFYKELRKGSNGRPSIFIAGFPGSFYGRLFPDNCLHFIYSSYGLHWLSQVPPALYDEQGRSINKGNIYISKSSPPSVSELYLRQFQEDFALFLRSRSEELIEGGRMVLILLGRRGPDHADRGNTFFWELLSRSLAILVSWGEVEEEKLHSYAVNFYAPTKEEIEEEVRREGSFELDRVEMFEIEKDGADDMSYGTQVARTVRAIQESMISLHFGEGIADSLFENYGRLVDEEMAKEDIRPITFLLVLRKSMI